ncbi:hypothetical protein KUTeg_024490 [Tegillarca granosa]|uniref:Sulfatase N-terminal domain-containing protein n=1 Tax=Tegillarca granosa TaxID=220873 RepID=A0ABQ9E1H9_TEGGR|nr:hypothetical protein KUTeg_024490 [Tegillarca granosa]
MESMVTILDEAVGNVTQALESRGFMNNALIVFTSDNGGAQSSGANNSPLRGSKGTLFEGGTRVPGFAYSQNLLQYRAYVNQALIHAVDWFPTLISAAEGTPDVGIDGIDQWETIRSNATTNRTEMVYNIDDLGGHSAIRVGDYKLIRGKHGHFSGWYPLYSNGSYQAIETAHGHTGHHAMLFNLKAQHYDIVTQLQHRLQYYRHTAVPVQNPSADDRSDPQNYGGYWSPGWC